MADVRSTVSSADQRMDKALEHLRAELVALRTGRASTSQVENIMVEQFGQMTPLKAVASISTPDAKTIAISPWDRTLVPAIEKLLRENPALGMNPMSDGNVIRLNVPQMTEERRREVVKELGSKVEDCHISMRNIRHEILGEVKKAEKAGGATQDDQKWAETELNKKIEQYRIKITEIAKEKEAEIMTV